MVDRESLLRALYGIPHPGFGVHETLPYLVLIL